ncbi:MAG: UDP-3-O-[3-hydroxymyristoyl] N-acetylglucosamine deacetylase, partial [Candidatus Omnitrophica bacterium]|nr:UDP-3-O-[3-hydroxymyristoyl] N-acetylglucosamine deacetylase [Candidatus Omnitrophota bacterium]
MDSSLLLQRTIRTAGSISGVGLHTGAPCTVHFKPAPVGSGIRFFKDGVAVDFSMNGAVQGSGDDSLRCTSIRSKEAEIQTVEHLLATLHGFQISNLRLEVDGPEIPGLDGSAKPFVELLKRLGVVEQEAPQEMYRVTEPILCSEKGKAIAVYPSERFSVSYTLDYPHPMLRDQRVDFTITPEVFEKEIAPARTFCTEKEGEELKKRGFGKGANYDNTVVLSQSSVVGNTLRFTDECARHKALDILGDLKLLEFPILGRVVGLRSGHALNQRLVEQIKKQRGTMKQKKEHSASKFGRLE